MYHKNQLLADTFLQDKLQPHLLPSHTQQKDNQSVVFDPAANASVLDPDFLSMRYIAIPIRYRN